MVMKEKVMNSFLCPFLFLFWEDFLSTSLELVHGKPNVRVSDKGKPRVTGGHKATGPALKEMGTAGLPKKTLFIV
ncbi:hypothetical protein GSUB_08225 [Geoalkalibacter subterraneus]|jgi:hypothetical protein|uniref:Uncharacterized protein n=1 Tax=Geoalkalibacter subterraneus TaxID=483547 RepID=A0A0B5FSI4_9BACT|nr:hypothetical protein GSUB_08225 [Geoalkalibacter subterraneus]